MIKFRLAVCAAVLFATVLRGESGAVIEGTVVEANGDRALAQVVVRLLGNGFRAQTDAQGYFSLSNVPPGEYVWQASMLGYVVQSGTLRVEGPEVRQLQVVLSPDAHRRIDTVAVHSESPLRETGEDPVDKFSLGASEIRNLDTVLASDPLRAVQAIPGVSANDDFEARFSVRGADPNRVGIYLDGIQLHQAVHTLEGVPTSGSNSVFNADLVGELNLYSGSSPARLSNSSAGALEVRLRDGSFDQYSVRAEANFAYGGLMASGPAWRMKTGRANACSWISALRKSYLQYLLQETLSDPSMSFGFEDVQGRMTCRVNPWNTVTLDVIGGDTGVDLSSHRSTLGPNSLLVARQNLTTVNLGWQSVAGDNLLLTSHVGWIADQFHTVNPEEAPLGSGNYAEWTGNTNAAWMWRPNSVLNAGGSIRGERDAGYLDQYNGPAVVQVNDRYRGAGTLTGGYVEQSWGAAGGRLHVTAGGRWDHDSLDGVTVFSPQGGVTFSPWRSAQLLAGWGQAAQFPEVSQLSSNLGNRGLLPIRSSQASAAFEQRLGEKTRVRATFYNRQDRDLLDQPQLDPRLINGVVFNPPLNAPYQNSLRGYGRGVELLLQRSSAKGWTGWIAYAYGRSNLRDGSTGETFPSDYDQRHTLNAYASYRLRPSLNVSARYTYGSGYPIPGYLQSQDPIVYSWANLYQLGAERNQLRVGTYQRLDLRVNKSWTRSKWKKTLYGEVMNVTNRANYRFDNFEGYGGGQAYITLDRMFPVLPSIGFEIER